jgi:hypothetical protein
VAKSGKSSKLGKRDLAMAVRMRRKGATLTAIAEQLRCSVGLISAKLKEAEAEGTRLPPARTGRPRKAKKVPRAHATAKVMKARKPPAPPAPEPPNTRPRRARTDTSPLPTSPEDALHELHVRRLPEVAQHLRDACVEGSAPQIREWYKLQLDLIERIRAATPPPEPDAADDPANVEARDRVRQAIEHLCHIHERTDDELIVRLCSSCRPVVVTRIRGAA